jgi:hypothetical protein
VLAPCEPASALVLAAFMVALAGRRACGRSRDGARSGRRAGLPVVLWIASSARGASGLAPADATKWALVLKRLPELVAPGFIGRPELPGSYWGYGLFETGLPFFLSIHVGGAVLLLALLGLRGTPPPPGAGALERRPTLRPHGPVAGEVRIALAGSVFLVAGARRDASRLEGLVPGAALFRYPEKFFLGTVLAIAVLAASGVDRLLAPFATGGIKTESGSHGRRGACSRRPRAAWSSSSSG